MLITIMVTIDYVEFHNSGDNRIGLSRLLTNLQFMLFERKIAQHATKTHNNKQLEKKGR